MKNIGIVKVIAFFELISGLAFLVAFYEYIFINWGSVLASILSLGFVLISVVAGTLLLVAPKIGYWFSLFNFIVQSVSFNLSFGAFYVSPILNLLLFIDNDLILGIQFNFETRFYFNYLGQGVGDGYFGFSIIPLLCIFILVVIKRKSNSR
jgi:hypothetical protein